MGETNVNLVDYFKLIFSPRIDRLAAILTKLLESKPTKFPDDIKDWDPEEILIYTEGVEQVEETLVKDYEHAIDDERDLRMDCDKALNQFKVKAEEKIRAQEWLIRYRDDNRIDSLIAEAIAAKRDHGKIFVNSQMKRKRAQRRINEEIDQTKPAPSAPALIAQVARLPIVPIPTFEGDILEYHYFWKMFANKVDDKPATDEEKFTILLSYLKRGPYHLVKNIPINAEGYKAAKQLLKEHYGNKEETRDLITSRLMSTRKCHNGSEVRNMFRYVDGLMSQLEEIEKSPLESKEIQRHIEQQLTPEYAGKVIDEQGKTPVWNLKAFREAMRSIITRDEKIARFTMSNAESSQRQSSPNTPQSRVPNRNMAFASIENRQNGCLFCDKNHRPSQCPLPQSKRLDAIMRARKCTRCLRVGHFNRQCKAEPCRQCKKPHHTFLCRMTNDCRAHTHSQPTQENSEQRSSMTFAGTANAAFRRHKPKIMRGPITFKSAGIKSKEAGNFLMMTRLATVFNPKTGKSTKVSIMFDQGSTE